MNDQELSYLRDRVLYTITGFQARLSELEISEFPTGTPNSLIELVRRVMTLSASKVEISRDKNTTLRFFQLVMMFTDIFDSLDQANSEQTPRGIVQLISKLVDSDVQILVSPQQNYNLSIIDKQLRRLKNLRLKLAVLLSMNTQ